LICFELFQGHFQFPIVLVIFSMNVNNVNKMSVIICWVKQLENLIQGSYYILTMAFEKY